MRTGKEAGSSANPEPSARWRPIGSRSSWFEERGRGEEEPGFIPVGIPRDRQLFSSHGILVGCACSVGRWGPLQTLLHLSAKGGHTGNLVWSLYRFWVLICRLCWIVFCLYNIKYVRKYSFEANSLFVHMRFMFLIVRSLRSTQTLKIQIFWYTPRFKTYVCFIFTVILIDIN